MAVENLDPVIKLIRGAKDAIEAKGKLTEKAWPVGEVAPLIALIDDVEHLVVDGQYILSEEQAKAILEMRLQRLTGLERDKIATDLKELCKKIEEYLKILSSKELLFKILVDELARMKELFANERRSSIEETEFEGDIEDLIQREDMVVTVSDSGYIKRVPLSTYRAQNRGGKGRSGMSTKDEDFVFVQEECLRLVQDEDLLLVQEKGSSTRRRPSSCTRRRSSCTRSVFFLYKK